VLLIEAGGANDNAEYTVPADRYALMATTPSLNWGYKTAPQTHLKGQQIDYSRGKGLGGSTAINFSCWIVGGRDDYDAWAEKTGDDSWKWDGKDGVKERIKKIEHYHTDVREEQRRFVDPKPEGSYMTTREQK
jgi:choline dehydrogenase-like flavoprotein